MKKAMFVDIKIGDKVWDICEGWGVVSEFLEGHDYPICVEFEYVDSTYTRDGYYDLKHVNPSLFWDEVCFAVPKQPARTVRILGKDVPDLRFVPNNGEAYYYPCLQRVGLCGDDIFYDASIIGKMNIKNNLCYPCTEAGKEAAKLHARAMVELIKE